MAFAGHCGLDVELDGWAEQRCCDLFNEELGAIVQIRSADRDAVRAMFAAHGLDALVHDVARPTRRMRVQLELAGETRAEWRWTT